MVVINNNGNNNEKGLAQSKNNVTARLLVLGDKQVGKSASIVRYTTGRFIQEYSDATSDWLYRHPLGFDAKRNQNTSLEILEQKDIKFTNSDNFFSSSTQQTNQQNQTQSLACRVALDQQLANELHEKQEMLNKLHWADAYIVIYAINDKNSFNKAIKYLNLIANNINSPIDSLRHTSSSGSSCSNGSSSGGSSGNGAGSSNFFNRLSPGQTNGVGGGNGGKLSPGHLSGNSASNSIQTSGNSRRPILLLGNKRDLERSGRQVSASDGRLLAIRHQSMFAELSIVESSKLIESFFGNLIEQLDPGALHVDTGCCNQHQLPDQTLGQWRPTVEAALSQSSVQLTAPIWGNLVKSKPVLGSTAMLAQSSKIVSAKLETSETYSIKPVVLVAQSVEVGLKKQVVGSLLKRNFATSAQIQAPPMPCTNPAPTTSVSNYQSKYKNLKSSFKKASMAIVSGKTLARNSNSSGNQQKRSSTTSSEQDSINELSTTSGQSLRNTSLDGQNINESHSLPPTNKSSNTQMSDRFRRPLFRYKNRRTTVAFEEIVGAKGGCTTTKSTTGSQLDSRLNQSKLSLNKASSSRSNYDSARDNSARSSSSLSTSDTNFSSSLILCDLERPMALGSDRSTSAGSSSCSDRTTSQTASLTLIRHNSNATLSRASTSGGSYDDSGDELPSNLIGVVPQNSSTVGDAKGESAGGLSELLAKHHQLNQTSPQTSRKRYDLVKSVQSTLSNLTRSSNISSQTPKRSFCKTLFRHTNPHATLNVKKITEPVKIDMAKAEHIGGPMPVMACFCE